MDRKPSARRYVLLAAVAIVAICRPALAETKRVSVFNFQMKSETPEWVWLEKGLADRITTDLHQSRALTLIARDRMQRLAMKIRWVPDLATRDPGRFGRIRSELRIKYVVSGVYTVDGDRITISTHVIEVNTRKTHEYFEGLVVCAVRGVCGVQCFADLGGGADDEAGSGGEEGEADDLRGAV